jgi:hypothetical protein
MASKHTWSRNHTLLLVSFIAAAALVLLAGLKDKESNDIVNLVIVLAATMSGFGLVAFQIGRSSNELKTDFIDTSIIMIISTILGFFYVVYPTAHIFGVNFGEASIFVFFWSFIMFLIVLVDRRFNILK